MCIYCACAVHTLTHFNTVCLRWLCSKCLRSPCQSDIWWLTTARRNSYQPVSTVTLPSWLPFMTCRICILRTLTCQAEVICSWYANCGAIAVIASTTYVAWRIPRPLLLWDDGDSHWSRHQLTSTHNGNRKKHQSLLLRGRGSGSSPSSPPSCFLSWHGD